jgi:hypothetical protein
MTTQLTGKYSYVYWTKKLMFSLFAQWKMAVR